MWDRIGRVQGNYMWNATDSFPMRSLPPWIQLDPYLRLEHTRTSLPEGIHIRSGRVAPAFEQPGGGTQHLCEKQIYVGDTCVGVEPVSVAELIARGIVKPLADDGGREAEE